MKKIILATAVLSLLVGCSAHSTTTQDVRSYCGSITSEMYCEAQDSICSEYAEVTMRTYKTVKECRQSCEDVRQRSNLKEQLMTCSDLYRTVEGKCAEFCDDNYK